MIALPRLIAPLLAAVAALLLAACAATKIESQWKSPKFSGPPLKRILVVGVTQDATLRRVFEDGFAAELKTRGVTAIPSYTLVPDAGEIDRPRLEAAVKLSGAEGVIVTRVVKREEKTQIVSVAPMGGPGYGLYGYYGAAWGPGLYPGYTAAPAVFQYEMVYLETRLFETRSATMVWSANSDIFSPTDPKKDTADFSKVIVDALAGAGMI